MKLEHANLTVASIDEAVRFLGAAFEGCTVRGGGHLYGDESLGEWVHFGNDDFYLALQQNRTHTPTRETTYTNDGINHIGFVVEGLDQIMARLTAAGYELSEGSAMDDHPHRRRAYYFDGNGVEWEFVEYLSENLSEKNDYSL